MAKKESVKIIYTTIYHGRGIAVGVDSNNWTILHYAEGQDPLESRNRRHFTSLPKMLVALHKQLIKARIKHLPFLDLANTVEQSFEQVEILGKELVKEILRKAPHGVLPRFPCNHVLWNDDQRKKRP